MNPVRNFAIFLSGDKIIFINISNGMKYNSKILLIVLVFVVAVFFRFYKLDQIPPGLYPDVAVNGTDALAASQTGEFRLYYPENNGREGLFINLIASSFMIFGPSVWAIKFVAALFGTLTVFWTYFLVKQLFTGISSSPQMRGGLRWGDNINNITSPDPSSTEEGRQNKNSYSFGLAASDVIALLSTFFLAVSFWHVNFSRLGFRAIMVPFFLVFSVYYLLKGLACVSAEASSKTEVGKNERFAPRWLKYLYLLIAGLFFGFGFHTYISFRVAPLILLPIFIFDIANNWPKLKLGRWLIFVLGVILAAAPMAYYFYLNPDDFMGRATQVSVFASENPIATLALSTIKTIGQFLVWGDGNWRHNISGSPQVFWPLIPLFIIGIAYSIKQIFRKINYSRPNLSLITCHWVLLLWWSSMLLPSIFTNEGLPHSLRSIGAIPPTFIFIGLGLWLVINKFKNQKSKIKIAIQNLKFLNLKPSFYILIFAFCIILVGVEYYRYFVYWGQRPEVQNAFAKDLYDGANYLKDLPPDIKKFVIMNEGSPDDCHKGISISSHTIKFIAPPKTMFLWRGCPEYKLLIGLSIKQPVVFLPLSRDENLFAQLKQSFPNGTIEPHENFSVFKINF